MIRLAGYQSIILLDNSGPPGGTLSFSAHSLAVVLPLSFYFSPPAFHCTPIFAQDVGGFKVSGAKGVFRFMRSRV